jgi:ACS family hexuronate transporter-like MFS transporter
MSKATTVTDAPRRSSDLAPAIPRATLIAFTILMLGETTINWIDRQALSVLQNKLQSEFSWSNVDYAWIVNAFMLTYLVSYSLAGWVLDRIGIRRGLTISVIWWSAAGVMTSLSTGLRSMSFFRSLLAVGEGGAWPAFAKAASAWVPEKARSLFIGVCNSGSSLGIMIATALVAWVTLQWNWRAAFIVTGLLGFIWVLIFQLFMRRHPEFSEEDAQRRSAGKRRSWFQLIGYRQAWAVFLCRFLADPMWYLFVFWTPGFLQRERGLTLADVGFVAWIPFLAADVSNFLSGYVALRLQRAEWSVNRTRKTLMVFSACLSPIGIGAVYSQTVFWTITFLSLAVFFWMFWSVSVHTLAGDYFPASEVGSVYGFAGTGSTLGSAITTWGVGRYLDISHNNYAPVFIGIAILMPIALIVALSTMGRVERVAEA